MNENLIIRVLERHTRSITLGALVKNYCLHLGEISYEVVKKRRKIRRRNQLIISYKISFLKIKYYIFVPNFHISLRAFFIIVLRQYYFLFVFFYFYYKFESVVKQDQESAQKLKSDKSLKNK